jgi:hypothetical protein
MALLLILAGCKAAPPQPAAPPPGTFVRTIPAAEAAPALREEPLGGAPEDLEIDVTVLVGKGLPEGLLVEERAGRYVLFPDGSLHAETGPYVNRTSRPGRARRLYQQQFSQMWAMCTQTGFADASLANGPANSDMIRPEKGERIIIVDINANGRRWSFVRLSQGQQPVDAATAKLVRTLAALAWIPDYTFQEIAPERYDYGPDPYAPYRNVRAGRSSP